MELIELQHAFPLLLADLIREIDHLGYDISMGECYRPPEMAEIYAAKGLGIKNSNHTRRIAVDLNLFKGGAFLAKFEDYEPAGIIWEEMSHDELLCRWGGRFQKPDCFHFSLEYQGVR